MATIQIKRGVEANLPSLAVGEPAFTTDTFKLYIGSSGGNKLLGGAGSVVTTYLVDEAVTFAKMQHVGTSKILGRYNSGTGDIEEIALGTGLSVAGGTLNYTGGGSGTVTSVGLSAPVGMAVSGSPVTTSGTISLAWNLSAGDVTPYFLGRYTSGTSYPDTITLNSTLAITDGVLGVVTSAIAEDVQDIVESMLSNTDTVFWSYNDNGDTLSAFVRTQMSLAGDSGGIRLAGDQTTPGSTKYYGTDSSGNKGWHSFGATQTANTVWAGPTTGSAAAPTFRALVTADLPTGIPYTNLANVTASRLLGRGSASGDGTPVEITIGSGLSLSGTTLSAPGGSGTVTSVGLTVPSILSVSGSPVTSSGTLAVSLASQTGNLVLASPSNGTPGPPTFRAIVGADLAALTITDRELAPASVTVGKIDTEAVTTGKIYPGAVTESKIGTGAVTEGKLGTDAVTTTKIADGTVTLAKLASMTDSRLLGRSAGSAGTPQEITVGAGLSLSGGSLTCTVTPGTGTVTSVGASAPALMQVSGSPVTTSGTIDLDWNLATARLVGRTTAGSGDAEEISVASPLTLSSGSLGLGTVTEAKGGTNQTTYTTGDLLYASASNTLSKRAIGSTGQVLSVASGVPAWRDEYAATNDTQYLSSSHSITATDSWQNTGLSITLPAAGTYLIHGNVRGAASVSGGNGQINCRLYDTTNGAVVTDSERMCVTIGSGTAQATAPITLVLTVSGSVTIRLEAQRTGSASTWTTSQIVTTSSGKTSLGYVRLY